MSNIPRFKIKWVRVESGIRKRTNDDGSTVYEVRVRHKGMPERTLTCPTLREARKQRERVRFLSADERTRLFQACARSRSPWLYQIVLMALVTGARKSEILTLRWRDIDVHASTVRFRNTKNGSDRTITLVDPLLTLLRDRHRGPVIPHPESYVFPAPCGTKPISIRTAWETVIHKANIENFNFHDLRHTTASYLRIDGHSLEDIGDVLGHRSLAVTRRYAHLDDSYQRKMLNSTMSKVFGEGTKS